MRAHAGFTFIELLVVVAILGVVATASVPFAEFIFIREKEGEFENNLKDIRKAIGRWRRDCEKAVQRKHGLNGVMAVPEPLLFPPDIASLTKSLPHTITFADPFTGAPMIVDFYHDVYLREIPVDPFVGRALWVQHYASGTLTTDYDQGNTTPAPGVNVGVFDVSATSTPDVRRGFVYAIDGTKYKDW